MCVWPAGGDDQISRAELRLTDIADALQSDWVPLARQLGLTQQEIIAIQRDYTYVSEQVHIDIDEEYGLLLFFNTSDYWLTQVILDNCH